MVNCIKCYRLRRHKDTIYCPFFDLQECVRGEHYINLQGVDYEIKPEPLPPLVKDRNFFKTTPPFKPFKGFTAIDWDRHHDEIFRQLSEGIAPAAIAENIGLSQPSVLNYINRYR